MHELAAYLMARKPEGMNYSDAVTLCFRLYCTVDGVPHGLLPLSRQTLSDVFSQLSSADWVRGTDGLEVTTPSHWSEMIDIVLRKWRDAFDIIERGEALAREVGFVDEKTML